MTMRRQARVVGAALAAVVWAGALLPAFAEEATAEAPTDYSRSGVGFAGGGTSGIGFAWRKVFDNGLGYQVGGSVWLPSFNPPSGFWSFGLQGLKVIDQTAWWRLYAIAGVQTLGQQRTNYRPVAPPTPEPGSGTVPEKPAEPIPPETFTTFESILNVGGGIGLELGGAPGVTLAIELPLVVGLRFGENPGIAHLMPIPNVLLLYNF